MGIDHVKHFVITVGLYRLKCIDLIGLAKMSDYLCFFSLHVCLSPEVYLSLGLGKGTFKIPRDDQR